MSNTITRRRKKAEVEISIVVHKKKYDLYIEIAEGMEVPKEIRGNGFTFKLTYFDGTTKVPETLHFVRRKKPYNCKKDRLQDSFYIIRTKEYKLVVSISPSFYASDESLKELMERKKERTKKKGKKCKAGTTLSKGNYASAWSKSTPFTHNNAFRPYSGGHCSPK